MTVDQIIAASKHWRLNRDSLTIARAMNLPESTIYNNLWRITRVADRSAA
jgi:hypothetical protein